MMNVAAIQMNSGPDRESNIEKASLLVEEALSRRAQWVCLPEYFTFRGPLTGNEDLARIVETMDGPVVRRFSALARKGRAYLLLGSIYEKSRVPGRAYNTSVLIGPDGAVRAAYRKINLFHFRMPAFRGREIRENELFDPGCRAALVKVGPFTLGMTICFDVRFPVLYEKYARSGANVFTIPSSFAWQTGQAHWELLVRARAVETFSYCIAPDQAGVNAQGVPCWGQSLIVDPWGKVLARASNDREEIIYARINPKLPQRLRRMFPGYKNMK